MFCAFLRQHCIPGCILGLNMETPESELFYLEYPNPGVLGTGRRPSVAREVAHKCSVSVVPFPSGALLENSIVPWDHLVGSIQQLTYQIGCFVLCKRQNVPQCPGILWTPPPSC